MKTSGVPVRHRHAQAVAQPGDVLDRGPALLTGDAYGDHPARVGQAGQPRADVGRARLGDAGRDLVDRQRAEDAQQVGHGLGGAGAPVGGQPLQLGLDLGQHLGVEQLAQLGAAEQLGQQPLVEAERRGSALGDRGVALVDELGDVPEQQAAGVGARRLGGDVDDGDLAPVDPPQQGGERGQVVDVLEALADGLEDDREGWGTSRRPRAAGRCAGAAATAGCGGPGRGGGAAGRGRRTRGSGWRTARSRRPPG